MRGIGNTTTENFASIMSGTKRYFVPKFQRDYSWKEEHWGELWSDITEILNNEEGEHYMGYLVLLSKSNDQYDIIDGQQRLTTISILILSVLDYLYNVLRDEPDVEERIKLLKESYIGKKSSINLTVEHKLTLNRNNTLIYNRLIGNENLPKRLQPTEALMKNCFEYFYKQIVVLNLSGVKLASFVESITSKLYFTRITVTDELNAYKVFETLNSTGVKLSSTDLLKNYLFQLVDSENTIDKEEHLKILDDKWAYISTRLENDDFPDYLRAYWNGRKSVVEHKNLYKTVRKEITQASLAFDLVSSLEQHVEIYKGLITPRTNFFDDQEIQEQLTLLKLFKVTQPIPLLMVAHQKFKTNSEFKKVLRDCVVFAFRYNVICGLNPNGIQAMYNKTSLTLLKTGKYDKSEFKDKYPDDDFFVLNFCKKEFNKSTQGTGLLKTILTKIENTLSKTTYSFTEPKITVEHIVPEKFNPTWGLSEEIHSSVVHRIGNHTLLSKNDQNKAGNEVYDIKRKVYKNSGYNITKKIAEEYSEWNESTIDAYQQWIAEQAKSTWSINFLPKKLPIK